MSNQTIVAHTPGPWHEGVGGNLRVYGPDAKGEHSGLVALVFKGRANVRLIAAAPDLLIACKAALNDRMYKDWPGIADLLIAAIAEAEGE